MKRTTQEIHTFENLFSYTFSHFTEIFLQKQTKNEGNPQLTSRQRAR